MALLAGACARDLPNRTSSGASTVAIARGRDSAYQAAWLRGDRAALEAMLAPDYRVFDGEPGDLAKYREEFPRLKFLEYRYEWRDATMLGSEYVLLKNILWLRETLDGKEIKGRYWYSQIWARRDGTWLLLFEEEVALPADSARAQ